MLNDNEARRILTAFTRYGIDVPAPVAEALADATALREAAETTLAAITAETPPTVAGATAATVGKVIDAHLAYGTREARAEVARAILAEADRRHHDTAQRLTSTAMSALAAPFDLLGAEFVEHLAALDGDARPIPRTGDQADHYASLIQAAAALRELAELRDALARESRAPLAHPGVEKVTRCHVVPDIDTAQRIVRMLEGPAWEAPAIAERLALPGVTIAWHVPDEQLRFDNLPATAGTTVPVG